MDVHIPTVGKTIRGFAFVTFKHEKDAKQCLDSNEQIEIRKRPVQITHSLNKTAYESQKPKQTNKEQVQENDDDSDTESSTSSQQESVDSDSDHSKASEEEDALEDNDNSTEHSQDKTAVAENRCLFIRNVSFDTTQGPIRAV